MTDAGKRELSPIDSIFSETHKESHHAPRLDENSTFGSHAQKTKTVHSQLAPQGKLDIVLIPGNHNLKTSPNTFNVGDRVFDPVTGQEGTVVDVAHKEIIEPASDDLDFMAEQAWNNAEAERFYEQELKRENAQRSTTKALDLWAAFLPIRISNEVLGDYLEDINRRAACRQHWALYLRALSAMFWTGVNAVGYFLKEVGSRKVT